MNIQTSLKKLKANSEAASKLLKSFAHPDRLMILCMLADGEKNVGEMHAASDLSQSAFSQQLFALRKEKIVKTRKEQQQVFYSLSDKKIQKIIALLHELYCK